MLEATDSSVAEGVGQERTPRVLAGYRLLHEIGRGGQSRVYLAHTGSGRPIALKLVTRPFEREAARHSFEAELRLIRSIRHPNVARILDFGWDGDRCWIAMEHLEGESLSRRIRRIGRLVEADAIRIVDDVAAALDQFHRLGRPHGDVKPDNIMLLPDGRTVLIDFAVLAVAEDGRRDRDAATGDSNGVDPDRSADRRDSRESSFTGMRFEQGTPAYIPVEVLLGTEAFACRHDLHALGLTLYAALVGKGAFRSKSAVELCRLKSLELYERVEDVVAGLRFGTRRVIERALAADPLERPGDVWQFRRLLRFETASQAGVPSRPNSAVDPALLRERIVDRACVTEAFASEHRRQPLFWMDPESRHVLAGAGFMVALIIAGALWWL